MNTRDAKQLCLPFASESRPAETVSNQHHEVTAKALASVAILTAVTTADHANRSLSPQFAKAADGVPHDALRDKWWAIEDLLIRLARNFALSLTHDVTHHEVAQLVVHGVESLETEDQAELIEALKATATFEVRLEGRTWSFVRWVEQRGSDIAIQFIDPIRVRAWIASHEGGRDLGRLLPFLRGR